MSDTKLKDLNNLILFMHPIDCELAAMDGTGHTSDYADHYYAKIRGKCRKSYNLVETIFKISGLLCKYCIIHL